MTLCSVCGDEVAHSYACAQTHPGLCHFCGQTSFSSMIGYYEHPAPQNPPTPVVLSPQDVQALVRYQQHVQRLETEEAPHG